MSSRFSLLVGVAAAITLGVPAGAWTQVVQPAAVGKAPVNATKWIVDPVHSQVDFRVRHLVGQVRGTFESWYGAILTNDHDWTGGSVSVIVQTRTVNTGNRIRDEDLRSVRFLASDGFPKMTFYSTDITAKDSTVQLGGMLTLKGKTKHVVLKGRYRGIATDADGRERIGFTAGTTIDRRDFGMTYSDFLDGTVVGNEADITIAIEAVRTN